MNQALVLRILYFLVFCCTASWLPLMADYCKHRHLSGSQTGILLAITPLFMFLVQPVYGIIADKFGYKKTIIYASFFAAICYLGYLYDIGYNGLIVITILMSVFYNTIQPILDSLSLQYSVANPSFSYGSLRVMGAMGWAFTGIVTGQIIDKININWIFGVSAISMFLFVVFSLFLKRTKNENQTYSNDFSANNLGILLKNKQLLFLLLAVCVVSISGSTIWYFYSTYLKQIGATATLVGFGLSFQGICELPFFLLFG